MTAYPFDCFGKTVSQNSAFTKIYFEGFCVGKTYYQTKTENDQLKMTNLEGPTKNDQLRMTNLE